MVTSGYGHKTNAEMIKDTVLIALFAALMGVGALSARFITVSFFGVPITLQIMFAYIAGVVLGPRKGAIAMVLYLCLGLAGIPVFAQPPYGSPAYLFIPTFGFLLGFVGLAWLSGLLTTKSKNILFLFMSGLLGLGLAYVIGIVYFYIIKNFYLSESVNIINLAAKIISSFFLIDFIKIIFAMGIIKALERVRMK